MAVGAKVLSLGAVELSELVVYIWDGLFLRCFLLKNLPSSVLP